MQLQTAHNYAYRGLKIAGGLTVVTTVTAIALLAIGYTVHYGLDIPNAISNLGSQAISYLKQHRLIAVVVGSSIAVGFSAVIAYGVYQKTFSQGWWQTLPRSWSVKADDKVCVCEKEKSKTIVWAYDTNHLENSTHPVDPCKQYYYVQEQYLEEEEKKTGIVCGHRDQENAYQNFYRYEVGQGPFKISNIANRYYFLLPHRHANCGGYIDPFARYYNQEGKYLGIPMYVRCGAFNARKVACLGIVSWPIYTVVRIAYSIARILPLLGWVGARLFIESITDKALYERKFTIADLANVVNRSLLEVIRTIRYMPEILLGHVAALISPEKGRQIVAQAEYAMNYRVMFMNNIQMGLSPNAISVVFCTFYLYPCCQALAVVDDEHLNNRVKDDEHLNNRVKLASCCDKRHKERKLVFVKWLSETQF